ncbi:tyrosine-type recombinase/integrase [Streptomyces acidiscabies]|uniref:Tyrosine-type recombinase/integrase n=1 Tax=Streptomyces acidiscabies TaxID=42234 RepID=A0AAP6BKV9_9ACTN|nr:tyrosine-type recombinase/integrase [Streptomyces acidiscabies]MDX2966612.1 tyrosine-type recombinase/integrase [Streptomyces acidiscabies]MDX3796582.1 tyrosine-type recombinase/integrase [Streptomyces acidiscabies]
MPRRATNNPRQLRTKSCGCILCMEEYPTDKFGDRKRRRDCLGSWQARYRDADGNQKAKNFPKAKDANAFLDKVREAVRSGTYLDPKRGEITLATWWEEWWPGHMPVRPTTRNRKLSLWTCHIEPKWSKRKLSSIRHAEVQAWMRTDVKGHATQVKVRELMRALMRAAVIDDRIVKNPLDSVTITAPAPAKHPEELKPPTEEQYALVREVIPTWYRPLVDFAHETGMRWGEIVGLRACYLDLDKGTAEVRHILVDDKGTIVRQAMPKTVAGYRTVPLTSAAVAAARLMLERLPASTAVTAVGDGLCPEELVFRGPMAGEVRSLKGVKTKMDGVLRGNNFRRRVWIPAIKEVGLARLIKDPETGREEYWPRLHDYRHALASRLHARGVSEKDVQLMLGQERGGRVTWLYTHGSEGAADRVREALEGGGDGRHLRAVS